jgi:cobalt-zinc-cadmium efflux system outer membrane protein
MTAMTRMAALAALLASGGCAVAPLQEATEGTVDRLEARAGVALAWPPQAETADGAAAIAEPLTLAAALALAFERNPDIRRQYAKLGIAHGDLRDAARIANPTLSLAWLHPAGGGRDQTTRGISASFADLLLLPARRRLSAAEFRRVELEVGAALMTLARQVESAWYAYVAAQQVETLRVAVADAAGQEATLAKRFFEAGNIARLQLDRLVATAARAEVDALRARSDAAGSRAQLANLLGLAATGSWRTADRLSAPPESELAAATLAGNALSQRLDLAAVREEVAALEDALGVTRGWRLLGSVEAGYEWEREDDGTKLSGPTLALELPIFNQGQGAVARAAARLLDARARAEGLALVVENEVATGVRQLTLAREVSERYRREWLPAAASAVERQHERFNFMLVGAFDVLQAKREQYDAWQGYFESIRDYWIARSALRAATGGLLPGDTDELPPAAGPADILPAPAEGDAPAQEHEHHGDHSS